MYDLESLINAISNHSEIQNKDCFFIDSLRSSVPFNGYLLTDEQKRQRVKPG